MENIINKIRHIFNIETWKIILYNESVGPRSSIVGWCTVRQAGKSRVQDPMRINFFKIYLILPAAEDPGVYSAFNRN
jgi:hypothetical protein